MGINIKLTVAEQKEIERIRGKHTKVNAKVIDSIKTFGQSVPVNLVLEVRHLSLQATIIKLNAEIRECEHRDLESEIPALKLKHRRDDAISRAKEVARMNAFLKDMSRFGNEIGVTKL